MFVKLECFILKSYIIVERLWFCGVIEVQEYDICKSDFFKRISNNNLVIIDDSREVFFVLVEKF